MPEELTHFDDSGASRMVDVGGKEITQRTARAQALVTMRPETLGLIRDRNLSKGDVLEVARLAGIMATRQTRSDSTVPPSISSFSTNAAFESNRRSAITVARASKWKR